MEQTLCRDGCLSLAEKSGYHFVKINGERYSLHRIIWIFFNGDIPAGMLVDHVNRITTDNRIQNLRLATSDQNKRNANHRVNKNGITGIQKGERHRRYQARISIDGRRIHLGMFDTANEAHQAYVNASKTYHGDFSPFAAEEAVNG